MKGRQRQSGVTLIEMMIVVTIIGLVAAISFPSITSGLDSLRLSSASNSIVSLLNTGVTRAERRQQPVEVTIARAENFIQLRSTDPGLNRRLDMPEGIKITRVLPEIPTADERQPRIFMLYPGGTVPRFGVEIVNSKGRYRIVRVDPITGVPQIEDHQ